MRTTLRILAVIFAILAMRYFLVPPPWVPPPLPEAMDRLMDNEAGRTSLQFTPRMYEAHPVLLVSHIACGIVALLLGFLQFIASLRDARPAVHRKLGMAYVIAVVTGGATGLVLSCLMPTLLSAKMARTFLPVNLGFGVLSIVWPAVTLMAFHRARERRYEEHRAWMTRSYAVTFAAVTVRLIAPVILFATQDTVLTMNTAINTWPLNLLAAEWLVWRSSHRLPMQPAARPR